MSKANRCDGIEAAKIIPDRCRGEIPARWAAMRTARGQSSGPTGARWCWFAKRGPDPSLRRLRRGTTAWGSTPCHSPHPRSRRRSAVTRPGLVAHGAADLHWQVSVRVDDLGVEGGQVGDRLCRRCRFGFALSRRFARPLQPALGALHARSSAFGPSSIVGMVFIRGRILSVITGVLSYANAV